MASLLPPSTTQLERNVEQVASNLAKASAPLETLWDAQLQPANLLPWLGWAVGVDHWSQDWPEQVKRDAVDQAISIRRKRGTVWAVRRALEVMGFSDVEILEHAKQDAAWREAGGLYIDSSWLLDGEKVLGGDLVNPPWAVTTSWAQYALAFNIAEAPFSAADQRRIRDRVESAAPLRSELVALLYRYAAEFSAHITVSPLRQSANQNWTLCQGAPVHRATQLMGCWSLSGDYAPLLISDLKFINGAQRLTAQRAIGKPLDGGWGKISLAIEQQSHTAAQASCSSSWRLNESTNDRLDGSWKLNEILDGHRSLDRSWFLQLSSVHQVRRPTLSGARFLGKSESINCIGTTARGWVRNRRQIKELQL